MKAKVIRLILCSGQVYFTLMKAIQDKPEMEKIAIIRVEQISPFPYDQLTIEIGKYSNLKEIVWVQERHKMLVRGFTLSHESKWYKS